LCRRACAAHPAGSQGPFIPQPALSALAGAAARGGAMTALTQVEKESVKPLANREMGSLQRRTAAEQTLGSRLADCLAATPLAPAIGMGDAGPGAWLNYGELSLRVG